MTATESGPRQSTSHSIPATALFTLVSRSSCTFSSFQRAVEGTTLSRHLRDTTDLYTGQDSASVRVLLLNKGEDRIKKKQSKGAAVSDGRPIAGALYPARLNDSPCVHLRGPFQKGYLQNGE